MGEAVDELLRRAAVVVGGNDELRRGAERNEGVARANGAEADRADSGVTAARCDDHVARQAERIGDIGPERRDSGGPFDQRRENRRGDAGRHERLGTPAPLRLVEPPRARRVAHVRELFAGQRQTQIVLGQQHAGDARIEFRLMGCEATSASAR